MANVNEYHQRPFAQRFGAMGDKGEGAYLERHPTAHRLGVSRPAFSMKDMSANLRYTPDYLLPDGMYEVMGFSSRGNDSLKLKFEKLDALRAWNYIAPTFLWVWDSGRKESYCAPIQSWADACYQSGTREKFDDNDRPYWNLPRVYFPTGVEA